ncbi:reverse transcriptase domain-containing protein [Tanacetum coccineum]
MTHDPHEGVVRFIKGTDEVAYKMPHKIEQYSSLSDLEMEHTKSVYLRNEEDKRRGVEYAMSKVLGFYKECLELGPEYLTGVDEGEVTKAHLLEDKQILSAHLEKKRTRLQASTKTLEGLQHVADDIDNIQYASGGVETINVATGEKFNMRAMVLWIINDFPARSSLSGWSGQGYKACPTCNKDTPSMRVLGKTTYVGHIRFLKKPHKWRRLLEFNGEKKDGNPPREFGRDQIQAQLARLPTRVKGKHLSYGV